MRTFEMEIGGGSFVVLDSAFNWYFDFVISKLSIPIFLSDRVLTALPP